MSTAITIAAAAHKTTTKNTIGSAEAVEVDGPSCTFLISSTIGYGTNNLHQVMS